MRSMVVDGNDVCAVYDTVKKAAKFARDGKGPTFIEAHTYRLLGHMIGDSETYRTKEEVAQWRQRDPIKRLAEHLIANEKLSQADLDAIHARVEAKIAGAVKFAKESPYPDPEEVHTDFWL